MMSQLCFATFARALQKVLIQPVPDYNTPTRQGEKKPSKARQKMTSTDAYVVETLLRWIQDEVSIEAKDGFDVWRTGKTVSDLLAQRVDLHTGFGPVPLDPKIVGAGKKAFAEMKKQINPLRKADFNAELVELIKNDPEVSEKAAEDLLQAAETSDDLFYAMTFLSAISRPNKKREDAATPTEVGVLLAARNSDLCPVCRQERLFKTVKGERKQMFEIVKFTIADDDEETDVEAVCVKCAMLVPSEAMLFNDSDIVASLREIRERRLAADALQDSALGSQLHPAIIDIVSTLGERITTGNTPELSLDALTINEKIRPEFYELSGRIRIHVLQWYRDIEAEFHALEASGRNRFKVIAEQVKDFYLTAANHTDDQQAIFNAVADWIHTNSDSTDWNASVLVASFFIQNCEVFDEIA